VAAISKEAAVQNSDGFDFRALERSLKQHFQLLRKWFSPVPMFGAVLNSEVYFLLQKANCPINNDVTR
jgi:hypothetical protein